MSPRTGAERRRRRTLATRAGLVAVLTVGAGATGLWWSDARHEGLDVEVGLTARLTRQAEVMEVRETLVFDPNALGEHELVRRIDPPGDRSIRLLGVEGDDPDEVLELPRGDGGLTVAIGEDAGATVDLRYQLGDADDDVDLGTVNAPAHVEVLDDTQVLFEGEWDAHDPLRRPDDSGDEPPWSAIGLAVGLLALLAWATSLARSRREAPRPEPVDGLPSDHSPAEVGWLLRHGRVLPADLAATVVDLTARGFVLPFRRDEVLVLGQGRPPADLADHEQLVVDWLFGDWVRQADLGEQRAAIREHPERWSDLWTRFVEAVDARGQTAGLVERDVASSAVLAAAAAGLGLLLAGVAGTAHGYPGWLAAVLAGAVVLASATAFARRTADGEALAAAWEAFGTRLRHGEGITPHALAYAVTLGEEAVAPPDAEWPAQLVHEEVERHVLAWREAYLSATSVRGEPSERVRALLSLRTLRRRAPDLAAELGA